MGDEGTEGIDAARWRFVRDRLWIVKERTLAGSEEYFLRVIPGTGRIEAAGQVCHTPEEVEAAIDRAMGPMGDTPQRPATGDGEHAELTALLAQFQDAVTCPDEDERRKFSEPAREAIHSYVSAAVREAVEQERDRWAVYVQTIRSEIGRLFRETPTPALSRSLVSTEMLREKPTPTGEPTRRD